MYIGREIYIKQYWNELALQPACGATAPVQLSVFISVSVDEIETLAIIRGDAVGRQSFWPMKASAKFFTPKSPMSPRSRKKEEMHRMRFISNHEK